MGETQSSRRSPLPTPPYSETSPAVLVPGLHLCVGEVERGGQLHSVLHAQVFLPLEAAFQLRQLMVGEGGACFAWLFQAHWGTVPRAGDLAVALLLHCGDTEGLSGMGVPALWRPCHQGADLCLPAAHKSVGTLQHGHRNQHSQRGVNRTGSVRGQSRWFPEETQPSFSRLIPPESLKPASGRTGLVSHWPQTGFWSVDAAFGRKARMEKQNPIWSSERGLPSEQIIIPKPHLL